MTDAAPSWARLGAHPEPGGTRFGVWAPRGAAVEVVLAGGRREPLAPLADAPGWFGGRVADVAAGDRYRFSVDGGEPRPDPASRAQPDGLEGPSQVVDLTFPWQDRGPDGARWRGVPLTDWVVYELHVGAFTPAGSFAGVIEQLPRLAELGVTVLELLPVAEAPGRWNWGYDAVFPWAPRAAYGGARGLQALVDAAHAAGLAVVLDVVINHLGPEGNVLDRYGPYTHAAAQTPWGPGANLDGEGAAAVRAYWLEQQLHWLEAYRVDGLRLDAADTLVDGSTPHFLAELTAAWEARAAARGRVAPLIVELPAYRDRFLGARASGGHGFAGQWCDDLHHALHVELTGERCGYYAKFGGPEAPQDLPTAFARGSLHPAAPAVAPHRFVACAQNHDQVGNRPQGDRLAAIASPAAGRLATALVGLAPSTPLLFMGEEWGEQAPFPFFVDFAQPSLNAAVRAGRKREAKAFGWTDAVAPLPDAPQAFATAQLDPPRAVEGPAQGFVQALLALRRALRDAPPPTARRVAGGRVLEARWGDVACALFGLTGGEVELELKLDGPGGRLVLDSEAPAWGGPGSALTVTAQRVRGRLAPYGVVVFQAPSA